MAPAPFSPPPDQPCDERGADEPPVEHYGELEIERHVKGDGRALILYTDRRERPNAGGSQ